MCPTIIGPGNKNVQSSTRKTREKWIAGNWWSPWVGEKLNVSFIFQSWELSALLNFIGFNVKDKRWGTPCEVVSVDARQFQSFQWLQKI